MNAGSLGRKRGALGAGLIGLWALGLMVIGPLEGVARAGVSELKEQAKKTPETAEAGLALAMRLREAGLPDEAMLAVNRSLGKAKDADTSNRLLLERARIQIERGRMKQAQYECEKLQKDDLPLFHTCSAEAYLLFRRGSLALAEAEAALNLKPDDYDAMLAQGRALWVSGQAEDARKVLSDLVAASPNRSHGYAYLAEVLTGTGKDDEAIKALRRGLQHGSENAQIHMMLGRLLPPGEESLKLLQRATELRQNFTEAYAALGAVQLALRKLDDAEKSLRAAIKLNEKDADSQAALAEVFLLRPDPEAALKQARAALKLLPNNGAAKLIEAEALAAKGDIDLAIDVYQEAYGFQRRSPEALIRGARACLKYGRPTTSLAFAERATDDFPESAAALEVLGDVLAGSGDKKGARQAYNDALKKANPPQATELKKKLAALK